VYFGMYIPTYEESCCLYLRHPDQVASDSHLFSYLWNIGGGGEVVVFPRLQQPIMKLKSLQYRG